MKLNRKTVLWGVFAALLLGNTYSFALTLGRVRGGAILGKPLDVAVLVQSAADDDVSVACFDADVQYGEAPLEHSRVSIKVQAGPQPDTQWVRLSTDADVDDAVVRLILRSVCNPKTTRSYNLLSDVVSETSSATTVAAATASSSVHAAQTGSSAPASATVAKIPANSASSAPASASMGKKSVHSALKLVAAAAPVKAAGVVAAGKAKAATLNTAALEDLQRRVDDIAKLQSNSASLEDMQKSEVRAKAMEADIRGLQAVTAKNQKNIQMVADALEASNSQNYGSFLVYGLGAVLLLCLAGLAYVVTRKRAGGSDAAPWWSGQDEQRSRPAMPTGAMVKASAPAPIEAADSSAGSALPASPVLANSHDGAVVQAGAVVAVQAAGSPAVSAGIATVVPKKEASPKGLSGRLDFAHSGAGNLKSINTKEMLDVRQQAEFFMALGQHDEAVRLLESNIKASSDCNPLVFLDLLKIFHTLSRRAEFEQYREEFNTQFTGRIPGYADFLSEGNGLDAYEDICQQIIVLWPNEYTVDFIEQCLVRLPEDDPEQGIDLEAFKDLLLLYGVLKRLDQGYDSNLAPFSTSRTDPTQGASINAALGNSATEPLPIGAETHSAMTTPMNMDLDLDLDLSEELPKAEQHNNLIDFDMSAYMDQKNSDAAK